MSQLTPGAWTALAVADDETSEPRLDVFVARQFPELSRTAAQRLIEEKQILVNQAPQRVSYKLQPNDQIKIFLPPAKTSGLTAQNIPLHIIHQDQHLAVIEKPAGLVVHPAVGHSDGTLVNALLHHLKDLSQGSGVGGELRPGIVHRIDRNTSGVLLVTKTDQAHQHLAQQFKEHSITRKYFGLCWGPLPAQGEWNGAIGRDPKERKRMAITENGRRATTRYKALKHFGAAATLFEAQLLTGRTHQVRVHFAAHGFPLAGDSTYAQAYPSARNQRERGLKALRRSHPDAVKLLERLDEEGRQFLHAAFLAFTHPTTGQRMDFASDLPAELQNVMVKLNA